MYRRKALVAVSVSLIAAVFIVWGGAQIVLAQSEATLRAAVAARPFKRVTQEQREAAADRMKEMKQKVAGRLSAKGVAASSIPTPEPGGVPDYFGTTPNWAYSPLLRKFVDGLPGLGSAGANNLGQYIPVANPDTITYPGSDYYEIELREYCEKLHSDLPGTRLRGYVQVNHGTDSLGHNTLVPDPIHYLGPFIVARRDRPVRIKFTNKLPIGEAGDLFIPVDTTVMGAGMGPTGEMYTQNRGTLHLHGGISPWISDGTPHQWITPAGEDTAYPKGVSVQNVPDMPDPGDGSQTFFYTNQQSARLMFYHDHSFGITRLNVYAGEAAGYMITDEAEDQLIAASVIPTEQIPLIIQDKTFVDASTIATTDPTWNWGTTAPVPRTGDLWVPHVYVPAQNPADLAGMNATGRWHYGPWFWPPTLNIMYPPIPNPYYDPENAPWEPEYMPATPNPSMGMEAYNDTPLVNGTAYPKVTLQPKSYRLRILNAANDRFFNLQMYLADPGTTSADGRTKTEVKMVPAAPTTGFPELWPTDGRIGGAPDPATAGPEWIQIGTEGGFLPKPAVIPQQPVTWNMNPTTFNMGNVQDHSLLLGCAERADVIVDFSAYAGKTLILYNDAPTAFPALDARTDYFTGAPDMTDTGGTKSTQVGFGPNTRTIMQITIATATPAPAFDLAALNAAFASTATTEGVFQKSQNPIILPDSRYNSAYNASFTVDPYVRIYQTGKTFRRLDGATVTVGFEPKAIHDEMGGSFDKEYGRMSGNLGLTVPPTAPGAATFLLYGFQDRPTELLQDSMTPLSLPGAEGIQIWKITHNGVDTHPIHFHLFDVQIINRVGWDNGVRPPDDNELGWKDTIRVSPLEDTIVALRPLAPEIPFGVPDSIRPLNPIASIGSTMGFSPTDPATGNPINPPVTNQLHNFGWEYVWHCHILSHEEMDMMRPMTLDVARSLPATPSPVSVTGSPGSAVQVAWPDDTPMSQGLSGSWGNPASEVGFSIERSTVTSLGVAGPYSIVGTASANSTTYADPTTIDGRAYRYRVAAFNAAGEATSTYDGITPSSYFDSWVVTPSAGSGGNISPGTPQGRHVGVNGSMTFSITPDTGHHITGVSVDGGSVGATSTYVFANVTADHSIAASFAIDMHTLSPSAIGGGAILPATTQTVQYGTYCREFRITPDPGRAIVDVLVDGVSVGPVSTYRFTNVTTNHTISAVFGVQSFDVVPSAGPGGAISPSTTQTVVAGADSPPFTITPDLGYATADVMVDGVSIGATSTYTFVNVMASHTIAATFVASNHRIEETDSHLAHTGTWYSSPAAFHSGGAYEYVHGAGSVSVAFKGTGIGWLTTKADIYGIAGVSVDGGPVTNVDLYSATFEPQSSAWTTAGLTDTTHTVTISWTGTKNAGSSDTYVGVDAFDVNGTVVDVPSGIVRIQETDSHLAHTGTWYSSPAAFHSGGAYEYVHGAGSVSVAFKGTGIGWVTTKADIYGIAGVSVDGGPVTNVDLYSATFAPQSSAWTTAGLTDTTHTVTISWTGTKNAGSSDTYVGVDAFDVNGTVVDVPSGIVRIQETDSHLAHTGTWYSSPAAFHSGGAYEYVHGAGSVSVAFKGTGIGWVTTKADIYGIAGVSVDGGPVTNVDLYSATFAPQSSAWTTAGLTDTTHTVTISWTGTKNAGSSDTYVGVDAFDVNGTVVDVPSGIVRIQETDSHLAHTGTWYSSPAAFHSGGAYEYVHGAGSVSVAFKGTGIGWVTTKADIYGIAGVSVDGGPVTNVDLYSATFAPQSSAWTTAGLTDTTHTVTISWTGTKNAGSSDTYVGVDAFDVTGVVSQAP